ncbi:hypothetical protein [Streptomyces sp. NPDC051567]|uniref:hypothetical protein n=1 Tax=Streptomyces sp. NPDC051567 TaxID=3365660 RepID=UPI0037881C15
MSTWEKRLSEAGVSAGEPRRAFDVAAGLRRLAEEAGYVQPAREGRRASCARHELEVFSRWALTQTGAASHVKDLTALIGGGDEAAHAGFEGWTADVDIDGVQIFACTLYLARHPESARFWWQLAAGAGHSGAAYCLHLHHLSGGDVHEAHFWKRQMTKLLDDRAPESFIEVLESFTGYTARNRPLTTMPTRCLETEFERLVEQHDDDAGLICRPDSQLADRIHDLAIRH